MKLFLTKNHTRKDMELIYAIPNLDVSPEQHNFISHLHHSIGLASTSTIPEFDTHNGFIEKGPYIAKFFNVPSGWGSSYADEVLLLTLYLEEHENTHFFHTILDHTIEKLLELSNLNKAFYISTPHADKEAFSTFGKMISILTDGFFQSAKIHDTYHLGLSEIMVLGDKGSGKSSIVDYLIHGKFIPPRTPTLSPRVYHTIYNETDFRVLDVCCKEHVREVLEDHPLEMGKLPQAIVYVIDASKSFDALEKSQTEFNWWMQYLNQLYSSKNFSKIPVLILFNKIDLISKDKIKLLNERFSPPFTIPILRKANISVKEDHNMENHFSWLIKNLNITQKF